MYLPCIIERLNQKLTVANENFAGAKYYNKLAWLVNRELNGTIQTFPLVDEENETEIAIDDTYPLTVYHRLLQKPYSEKNYQYDVANCQMLMVVFGNKSKLRMDAEKLESQLISLFPRQFTSTDRAGLEGVTDISITLGTSNLSTTEVFNSEYRGARLMIDKDTILFSVRYDINITFKRDCLDFCDAVSQPDSLCDWIELSSWDSIGNCLNQTQLTQARAEICSPATAVLKNTATTTLSTTPIASGATANITAPDATAVLKNTSGTTITTEAIPSGASENITIANVAWTDSDGSAESTPYGNAIVCTPQSSLAVDFSADDTTPETNQTVTFTDLTVGGTTWLWDFGDGELSDLQNPTHAYKYAGTYSVTLHVDTVTSGGYTVKNNYITVTLQTVYQTNLQMHNKAPVGAAPSNLTIIAGNVSQWNDETANVFHRTQAVALNRPSYSSGGYVSPSGVTYGTIDYDGVAEVMRNNNAAFTRASGSYEVVVIKLNSMLINQVPFECASALGYELYINHNGAGELYNGTSSIGSQGLPKSTWVVIKIHWNGASTTIQFNNNPAATITNNIGTTSRTGSSQGAASSGGGYPCNCNVLEHLIYTSKPSDADIAAYIDKYLASKFGIW